MLHKNPEVVLVGSSWSYTETFSTGQGLGTGQGWGRVRNLLQPWQVSRAWGQDLLLLEFCDFWNFVISSGIFVRHRGNLIDLYSSWTGGWSEVGLGSSATSQVKG